MHARPAAWEDWSRPLRVLEIVCAASWIAMSGAGCTLLNPFAWRSDPRDHPAHPLTDEQTLAQVVEPAKQIDNAAHLEGVSGGASLTSCNDQGDPPYQGRVTMSFLIHGEPDVYFRNVADAMAASGWNRGDPPGQHSFGTTLNKDGVVATIGFVPSNHDYGQILIYGECRNTTNHRDDRSGGDTDITGQLPQH